MWRSEAAKWKFESRDLLVGAGKRLHVLAVPPNSDNRRNAAQVGQTAAIAAAAQFVNPSGPGFYPAVQHLGLVWLTEAVSLKFQRIVTSEPSKNHTRPGLECSLLHPACVVLTVSSCDP